MEETRTGGPLRRVLLAADRSAASRAALLAVAGLAVGGGTRVIVLHVDDRGRPDDAQRFLADISWGLIALAVDARSEVRRAASGRVAAEIALAAAEHHADLVVLGSRGRSDLGGLLLGKVGREVLERVRCPVLLVRAGRRPTGRRRRVLVAVAGDEVLAGLNPAESERAVALVRQIKARGVTIVMIEHVMQAVMSLSEHVFVLAEGRVIAEGTPASVAADPAVIEAYLGHGAARKWGAAHAY